MKKDMTKQLVVNALDMSIKNRIHGKDNYNDKAIAKIFFTALNAELIYDNKHLYKKQA